MNTIEEIEKDSVRTDLPEIKIGDDVDVTLKIVEGENERTQVFSGTVIGRKGSGLRQTFTVRRIVQGEGVERVFPLCSPAIVSIKTTRSGKTRQSKLYYLRKRVGKATKVKESLAELEAADGGTVPKADDDEQEEKPSETSEE